MKIILASGSPRRYDLLKQMGWDVEVRSLPFAEAETVNEAAEILKIMRSQLLLNVTDQEKYLLLLAPYSNGDLVCAYNALGKGKATAQVTGTEFPVISADTIVVLGDTILGKPEDTPDAGRMLRELSGKIHQVKTAVAVMYEDKTLLQVVTTNVYFRSLTEKEIDRYIKTGEPLDKAGAYGIQGKGAVLVEKIEGSYDNVVGLPLATVYEMLLKLGVQE